VEIMTSDGAARAEMAWPPGGGPQGGHPAFLRSPGRGPQAREPAFLLVLTHGSGGGPESADLLAVRNAVAPLGAAVALVTQPYRVKGHRAPGPPARQDAAWIEIIDALRPTAGPRVPLVQGGRSNGARVACRTAGTTGARAVLALAFPLHPPGHPEKSRADELSLAGTDVLVINGSRDPFGIPDQAARTRVVVLEGETHALSRNPREAGAVAAAWLADLPGLAHT
jgi:predicted alpha/beta-hydrolase family hydrolase